MKIKENIIYFQGIGYDDKPPDTYININKYIYINGKLYNLEELFNINKNKFNGYIIITFSNLIEYLNTNLNTNNKNFTIYNNNYDSDNYFILHNNKLISNDIKLKYIFENLNEKEKDKKLHNFNIIQKQKGGGGSIIDAFMSIIKIGELFLKIGDIIIWLVKFILWLVQFLLWFFLDLLNPVNFLTDFFKTLILITVSVCRVPFDVILALFKLAINTIAGWMQGFWGWDMSNLSKNDKNSPYFKSFDRTKGQKVYYTNTNTVPFSIILGTILCPPMGVFMDLGTSGWINIIICALLTLLFYLPGLCYALLIIYS